MTAKKIVARVIVVVFTLAFVVSLGCCTALAFYVDWKAALIVTVMTLSIPTIYWAMMNA